MTEEDIIKLIRAGGKAMDAGVKALYDTSAQPMLRFFVYKGTSGDEANDILQETLFKIVRNAASYSGQGEAKSWMWQIARNCLIDHQRKVDTVDSLKSIKAAKATMATAANEAAARGEEISFENGVKVTRLPYVGDITRSAEKIVDSHRITVSVSDDQWRHLENTTAGPKSDIGRTESADECVAAGLEKFSKHESERAFALTLQMDGLSIQDIGLRIGRTVAATKEYLSQCKKKIQPYIAHCTDLLAS
jgi:RNA polymerase sigma-70 factor (ECF subfamily)